MVISTKLKEKERNIFGNKLQEAIGADKVKDDDVVLVTYASDHSGVPFRKPSFIVLPESREDVIETLKLANKYNIPVVALSRGGMAGCTIPSEGGIVLDFRRMDKILEINTDSGYVVIEPGITFDKLTFELAKKGFRIPLPTAPGGASPLGINLCRSNTSLVNKRLEGIVDLEVVLPDGTVFNTGSSQFEGAGSHLRYGPFPDLAGLLTLSYGTMGVVTKAALCIYPINEANRVILAAFDDFAASIDYIKDLVNNNITEHCIVWNWQFCQTFAIERRDDIESDQFPDMKADPTKPPQGIPYNIVTTFLSGYEEVMVVYEKVCEKVARKYGGRTLSKEEAENVPAMSAWKELYANYREPEVFRHGITGQGLMWIVLAEPKNIKDLEKWSVKELAQFTEPPIGYYSHPFDFGRTVFFRLFPFLDPKDGESIGKVLKKYSEMYDIAMKKYGAVPLRYAEYGVGTPLLKRTGGYGEVLTRIKKVLDPNNILNRDIGIFQEDEL